MRLAPQSEKTKSRIIADACLINPVVKESFRKIILSLVPPTLRTSRAGVARPWKAYGKPKAGFPQASHILGLRLESPKAGLPTIPSEVFFAIMVFQKSRKDQKPLKIAPRSHSRLFGLVGHGKRISAIPGQSWRG